MIILGKSKSFDIPFKLNGSEFQMKVWNELLNIPYGETKTYKEIAKSIGNENGLLNIEKVNSQIITDL